MKIAFIFLLCTSVIVTDILAFNLSLSLEEKIVCGRASLLAESKCVASLRYKDLHKCSAFFISVFHALTAAHCLDTFLLYELLPDFSDYSLVAGIFDGSTDSIQTLSINEVEVHPKYEANENRTSKYNIGLITLMTQVEQTGYADWIPIMKYEPKKETIARVIGWGLNLDTESYEGLFILKQVTVQLRKTMSCGYDHRSPFICAAIIGDYDALEDDDIGSPLIQEKQAVGILVKLLRAPYALYLSLPKAYREISEMQKTRKVHGRKIQNVPRRRAKHQIYTVKRIIN